MTEPRSETAKSTTAPAAADRRLTREDACAALAITPELFETLERRGGLAADPDGRFDALAVAAAAVRYGLQQAEAAEVKLSAVGDALKDVKPALERLAGLPDRAELSGEAYNKVMMEVAAYFNAFAAVMNRATAALRGGEDEA
ncbi:MAG TPA: hypothetical protein VHG30_16925 [Microvirga sp.]|nr:hypothetical protein [Microvirga sp.]